MEFKIANLRDDYKILLQAKKDSEEYLKDGNEEILKERLLLTVNNISD